MNTSKPESKDEGTAEKEKTVATSDKAKVGKLEAPSAPTQAPAAAIASPPPPTKTESTKEATSPKTQPPNNASKAQSTKEVSVAQTSVVSVKGAHGEPVPSASSKPSSKILAAVQPRPTTQKVKKKDSATKALKKIPSAQAAGGAKIQGTQGVKHTGKSKTAQVANNSTQQLPSTAAAASAPVATMGSTQHPAAGIRVWDQAAQQRYYMLQQQQQQQQHVHPQHRAYAVATKANGQPMNLARGPPAQEKAGQNHVQSRTTPQRMQTAPQVKHATGQTARRRMVVTPQMIAASIPSGVDASIFQVYGRRINLKEVANNDNPSIYALLRSWVQDDPYRKNTNTLSHLEEYVEDGGNHKVSPVVFDHQRAAFPQASDKPDDLLSSVGSGMEGGNASVSGCFALGGKRRRAEMRLRHQAETNHQLKRLKTRGIRLVTKPT